jgi:hypothetical protein
MANANLSPDLSLDRLQPASSVRPVATHGSHNDPESKRRRREPAADNDADEPAVDNSDQPPHKIDSLA